MLRKNGAAHGKSNGKPNIMYAWGSRARIESGDIELPKWWGLGSTGQREL